jgi:hypothetical protein
MRETETAYGIGEIVSALSEHAVLVRFNNMAAAGDDRSRDWRFEVVSVAEMATSEYDAGDGVELKCWTLFESRAALTDYLAWVTEDPDNKNKSKGVVIDIGKRRKKSK